MQQKGGRAEGRKDIAIYIFYGGFHLHIWEYLSSSSSNLE